MAEEVDQDVVVLGEPVDVGEDAVKDIQYFAGLNAQPSFFQGFAGRAVAKLLAEFQNAAWDRPFSLERLRRAAHQQGAIAADDDCSYSNDRPIGIVAFHAGYWLKKSAGRSATTFHPLGARFIWKRIWVLRRCGVGRLSLGSASMSMSAMAKLPSLSEVTCRSR